MAYSEAMWAEAKKKCRLNNEDRFGKAPGTESPQPYQEHSKQE